jgi:putative intracellular protease/amidase
LLIAAGGANTLLTLHRAELLMTYVAAQYANGGVVAIQYDDTANGAGVIASTTQAAADFFDAADTANAFEGGIVKQPFATCVNLGLYLSNITGAFDTGDSTFVCHLWYSEIPTV